MRTITLLVALSLAGCGGSVTRAEMLAAHNDINVMEGDGATHDYKFYLKNVSDIGFDADREADRRRIVTNYLADECPSVAFVDETFLPLGKYVTGGRRGQYIMRVKCNR